MPRSVDETGIFAATVNVLVSKGYAAATTQEIARQAGVNEATLFRRYGTKANLIARTLDHQLADSPLSRLVFSGDLAHDLVAIVQAYIDTNREHGDIVVALLLEVPRHPELRESAVTPLKNIGDVLNIIAQHQAAGSLASESPWQTLTALLGPVVMNLLFRHADLVPDVSEIDPATHVRSFLAGRAGASD